MKKIVLTFMVLFLFNIVLAGELAMWKVYKANPLLETFENNLYSYTNHFRHPAQMFGKIDIVELDYYYFIADISLKNYKVITNSISNGQIELITDRIFFDDKNGYNINSTGFIKMHEELNNYRIEISTL